MGKGSKGKSKDGGKPKGGGKPDDRPCKGESAKTQNAPAPPGAKGGTPYTAWPKTKGKGAERPPEPLIAPKLQSAVAKSKGGSSSSKDVTSEEPPNPWKDMPAEESGTGVWSSEDVDAKNKSET